DPNVRSVISDIHRRVVTYGTNRQAMVRAENIQHHAGSTRFEVYRDTKLQGNITLGAPGLHNVQNALAAVCVGLELEVPFETITSALKMYTGVDRRFDIKGEPGGVLIVDDYAHHPAEIGATLDAAAKGWPDRRIIGVFQPHLYSRTKDLAEQFARSFVNADVLVLTDIYGAREKPLEGVDGMLLVDLARRYGHSDVRYVADKTELPGYLMNLVKRGDLVITMGAGDIWRYGKTFYEQMVQHAKEVVS
ncbi:MAG: cyanophycin synthetase, partial [Rubricoccaceae bacterium]|nr:cyanophycin synthetase [Rubricoccaceae bacterium]